MEKEALKFIDSYTLNLHEKARYIPPRSKVEKDIAKLEDEKNKITTLLNSSTDNHDDVVKWSEQIGVIISQLDEKSLRWLELSEGV